MHEQTGLDSGRRVSTHAAMCSKSAFNTMTKYMDYFVEIKSFKNVIVAGSLIKREKQASTNLYMTLRPFLWFYCGYNSHMNQRKCTPRCCLYSETLVRKRRVPPCFPNVRNGLHLNKGRAKGFGALTRHSKQRPNQYSNT